MAFELRATELRRGFGRWGALQWALPESFETDQDASGAMVKALHRLRRKGYDLGWRNPVLEEEISAHPDQLSNILVYADWLADRGDPRADWIRLHLGDPHSRASGVEELLAKHRHQFIPRLEATLEWKNGFIRSFEMRCTGWSDSTWGRRWTRSLLASAMETLRRHPSGIAVQEGHIISRVDTPEAWRMSLPETSVS